MIRLSVFNNKCDSAWEEDKLAVFIKIESPRNFGGI